MSTPQNYSASLVQKSQRFAQAQLASQRAMQQDVIVPKMQSDQLMPVDNTWWRNQLRSGTAASRNVSNVTEQTREALNSRYNYSYQIPEETKFAVRRRFTDEKGFARYDLLGKETQIGLTHTGPEFWDFVVKEMEREEAMGFKAFVFN